MAAICSLPMQFMDIRADQDIIREGDRPQRCCIIFEGMSAWSNLTGTGRRQIQSFHIAGDVPDLQSLHLERLDSTLFTLTSCKVGFVQHEVLHALCKQNDRVCQYFWRSTLIDAAIFRQWVTNVGGRQAYSRVAHLLCEMIVRLKAMGLSNGATAKFSITQPELADATGLSVVHLNRTIKQLREDGLIEMKDRFLKVNDWDGFQAAGDFDPAYLHLP